MGADRPHQAFLDYRLGAKTFSSQQMEVLRRLVAGERGEPADSGMSTREWKELAEAVGITP